MLIRIFNTQAQKPYTSLYIVHMADRLRSFCTQELYTRKEDQKEANQFESLTIDNDISFQKHKELSKLIEANIFFCHPQSPHEKGSVENRNKAVRRYIKKKSDLSSYPQEMLSFVENRLRDKYMKCLQYKTPREAFMEEMQKINTKKSTTCGIIESKLLTESVRIEGCA